jgi:hypothetical protein
MTPHPTGALRRRWCCRRQRPQVGREAANNGHPACRLIAAPRKPGLWRGPRPGKPRHKYATATDKSLHTVACGCTGSWAPRIGPRLVKAEADATAIELPHTNWLQSSAALAGR